MADNEPVEGADVTAAWAASQDQKGKAKKLRLFAGGAWVVAIGTEIAGIILLLKNKFDQGNLALLIGILVFIAVFAIAGNLLWKKANRHDPASKAEQAQNIVDDSEAVAEATRSEANPNGLDVVYWIAPKAGAERASSPLVFHLCENVSTLRGKVVNSGTVTEAYAQNAIRLTKQLKSEQRQCGFEVTE